MKSQLILATFLILFSRHQEKTAFIHDFEPVKAEVLNLAKMGMPSNLIHYVGLRDSLVAAEYDNVDRETPYMFHFGHRSEDMEGLENDSLVIVVDTTNTLLTSPIVLVPDGLNDVEVTSYIEQHRKMVEAYPVYFYNNSRRQLSISGLGESREIWALIQEAKDENDVWRPIEHNWNMICGNSMGSYVLNPGQFLITSAYKYSGSLKTEFRLALQRGDTVYYSNAFKGSLNEGQFVLRENMWE